MIDYRTDKCWTVYVHISPSNKYYVGITSQKPKSRWRNGEGYNYNTHFYRSIQKYGWDNFEHFIFAEHLTKEEACKMEKTLILSLKSNDYNYGYNLCSGGEGATGLYGEKNPNYGNNWSEEQKQKMSKYRKENPVITSEEGQKSKSDFMKNKWKDIDYRESMSGKNAPCYGRTGNSHPLFGKTGSNCALSKMVICLNTNEVFVSATEASKVKNVNYSKLCMCCRGERKSCGKDIDDNSLHWKFYDDYLKENNLTDEKARRSLIFID